MGRKRDDAYHPIAANAAAYDQLYAEYQRLHDYFGRGGNPVMRRLRQIKRAATAGSVSRVQAPEPEVSPA